MDKVPVEIKIDNTELGQYLEGAFQDLQESLGKLSKGLVKLETLKVDTPTELIASLNNLKGTLAGFGDKKLDINLPDFTVLQVAMEKLANELRAFKFPSEVSVKSMPSIKFPESKVDFSRVENAINNLSKTLRETPLQAELTNLDEMPMVLSQHAAKNLAEAYPIVHNLTLTVGGQEYEQAINGPTKGFIMQGTGDYDIQVRFSSTGNYWTIKSGSALEIGGYNEKVLAKSATAMAVLEIIEIH